MVSSRSYVQYLIDRLAIKLNERGFSLIPLEIYFRESRAKVLLGLGKGKKLYDKRQAVKEREMKRELARELGRRD